MQASTIVLLGVIGIIMGVNYYIKNLILFLQKFNIFSSNYGIIKFYSRLFNNFFAKL